MNRWNRLVQLHAPKLRILIQFLSVQGVTLLGNLTYGLLCVRLLPTADYAQFVVLFGVQGTLIVLMDVNLTGTLIPLIGDRVDDRRLIADYVATLRQLAVWVYVPMGLGLAVVYPYFVKNRDWNWHIVAGMVATLLLSTWFMRIGSAYGAVLIVLRDRNNWYKGQMISSLGTLAILLVFWACHALAAFSAILINVAGIVFLGVFYFFRARQLLGRKGVASVAKRKAIMTLALPNIVPSVFYALQGQIALFLITFFGHTMGVASLGALGRLGQVFALVNQMSPVLVEPYFSKLPQNKLKTSYFGVLALAVAGCIGVTFLASLFPELFLWILGPKYAGLRYEVVLVIASSAIGTVSGLLWCIHSARKFIYWWSNGLNIVITLAVQVLFALHANFSTVRGVLWLSLATNTVFLATNALSGVFGFTKGPRKLGNDNLPVTVNQIEALDAVEAVGPQANEV